MRNNLHRGFMYGSFSRNKSLFVCVSFGLPVSQFNMRLLWLCVATFLHLEVALLTLLSIPWIPSTVWNAIFKIKLSQKIQRYSKINAMVIVSILLVLFVDSIRDMIKYSFAADSIEEPKIWAQNDDVISSSRLFVAERNFYLVGSTLFLFLVIRRVVPLISRDAKVNEIAKNEGSTIDKEIPFQTDITKEEVKPSYVKDMPKKKSFRRSVKN